MADFKQQYKNPKLGFGDVNHRRYLRAYNCEKTRREIRTRAFGKNRNVQEQPSVSTSPEANVSTINDERWKKLLKWREERNKKKKLEASIKKPAFKVGIVHHSLYSPLIKDKTLPTKIKTPKKVEQSIQKRITRATEKRLLAKATAMKQETKKPLAPNDYCFKPPFGVEEIPLFSSVSRKQKCTQPEANNTIENIANSSTTLNNSMLKLNKLTIKNVNELNKTKTTELKEQKEQINVQNSLKDKTFSNKIDMETSSLQNLTPIDSKKEDVMEDLILFSPYLIQSRGKKNSRKEGLQRLGIGHPSEEIPTKDTVMQNLNICVEEEKRTAQYFKLLVNKETDRLSELCKKWLDIKLEKDIPEDAVYEIQQAVGQTNLLINKKFERFRNLVQDCETGRGEMLVTCRDLQGFWDMTYIEVENCDTRFEKLKQRQNRGWKEEEYTVKPAIKKRIPNKKQSALPKQSSLRLLIQAARKNKKDEETLNKENQLQNTHVKLDKSFTELPKETVRRSRRSKYDDLNESKSFRANQCENLRSNSMQSSSKVKKMKSPFAAMKISRMCKTPEVQLDDTISYVNSDQTPGKSILKKIEELENKEGHIKSAHKVNFDDQVVSKEVPIDEEMQIKSSLAAALQAIDSFSLDEIDDLYIKAEKRLSFEDSDSTDDLNELNATYSLTDITSSVKESSNNMKVVSSRKSLRNQEHKDISNSKDISYHLSSPVRMNENNTVEMVSKDIEDIDLGKVLRNRTIPANNTPRSSRINKIMTPRKSIINKEEDKSSVKSNRRSLRLSHKNKNMMPNKNDTMEMENVALIDNKSKTINLRKESHRKSVAFDESCIVCVERIALPTTPYIHRKSTPSKRNHSKQKRNEDLTSS